LTGPLQHGQIRVRLFAALRERAGWSERSIALTPGQPHPTASDLWWQLELGGTAAKDDGALPASLRVAINQAFASLDQPLQAGDELAFLPPISGG